MTKRERLEAQIERHQAAITYHELRLDLLCIRLRDELYREAKARRAEWGRLSRVERIRTLGRRKPGPKRRAPVQGRFRILPAGRRRRRDRNALIVDELLERKARTQRPFYSDGDNPKDPGLVPELATEVGLGKTTVKNALRAWQNSAQGQQ